MEVEMGFTVERGRCVVQQLLRWVDLKERLTEVVV